MLVRELIAMLQGFDEEARVVVEYDTHFYNVKAVQPQVILTEGSSWADFAGEVDLQTKSKHSMASDVEASQSSPRETAVAIWGTTPCKQPGRLSEAEYDSMMSELQVASDWMTEQLRSRKQGRDRDPD